MEDKIYDLLEKMHIEFSSRFDGMESRLITLEKGQQKLENVVTRLENKADNNSKTLFDGYRQTYEEVMDVKKVVNEISTKVDMLSEKVDKQEVEIKVIKGGKA